jgi:phage terminase large subunit-like protein
MADLRPSLLKAIQDFEEHCKSIRQATLVDHHEAIEVKKRRIAALLKDYGKFFAYYFPHYTEDKATGRHIPCAKFQIKAAKHLLENRTSRSILNWYRGAAKSTHANVGYAVYLWAHKELHTMVLVGENQDKADILLSDVQAEFQYNHRLINDFGTQYNLGHWSEGSFVLKDNTAFFSLGLGQSPRGLRNRENRPDYIVADDLDTKKRCKNPKLVREAVEWLNEDLMGCFGTFAERFVLVNNRISKTSIVEGMVKSLKKAYYSRVIAHDADFKPAWPERTSSTYWREKYANTPYRSYQREYLDNPIEEGTVFSADWIRWEPLKILKGYDRIVAYCDPSFKSSSKNDFKAIKVWGRKGKDLHLLRCFVRQCSVSAMVKWFYDLHESLPQEVICDYFMEANFMQDMLLDEFEAEGNQRGYQLPIRPDKRQKPDKFQRIEALSPLYERGLVVYNSLLRETADMEQALDQLLAFEKGSGSPDDSPDADEGAIWFLQKQDRDHRMVDMAIIGERKSSLKRY